MSRRRLDRLEDSVSPKEAVKLWLQEAHSFGSLLGYAVWLSEQPDIKFPLIGLPEHVETALRHRLRRKPRRAIEDAVKQAIVDTCFLVRLVVGINRSVEEAVRVEGLRAAALMWWMRSLTSRGSERADGSTDGGDRMGWPGWLSAAHFHLTELESLQAARIDAETRYLEGHGCLFPDLETGWHELRESSASLVDVGMRLARSAGVSSDHEAGVVDGDAHLRRVVDRARVESLDLLGYTDAAMAVARRELRDQVTDAP